MLKILAIEDNPADVEFLRFGLIEHGEKFELTVLSDGAQALEFIADQRRLGTNEPCAIVLDLHLPKHGGLEILRAIALDPVMSHIGVVVLSGAARPSEEEEIRRLGAYYHPKPMRLAEYTALAALIVEVCKGLSGVTA